ncbi:hypothetical protein GCM10018790_47210 [Kitasatospora xanthocidica]|uniref:hypothetical protein n=1 Tax=Kitasatospora xanthocidica TaxID=83382 RepID=UPI00167A5CBF|nr:hypothetical protein [Kitasatospora xanthocidica]GHF63845.1 hypothetical protein GCM10018790_47210 [Kitasatospora xanthocidica]
MDADGPEARDFVAALVRAGAPIVAGPAGLGVPEAAADEVIAVARRLALRAVPDGRWRPGSAPSGLLGVAAALVVDEHPSVSGWSAAERGRLATWVALLIEHRGEDGVQELVAALNGG